MSSCIPKYSCPPGYCAAKYCKGICYSGDYCDLEKMSRQLVAIIIPSVLGVIFLVSLIICYLIARKRRKQKEEMMRQRNINSGIHVQVQQENNFIPMYAPQTNCFQDYNTRIYGNGVPIQNYSVGQPVDPYAPNMIHYERGQPIPINGPNYFLKPGTTVGYVG